MIWISPYDDGDDESISPITPAAAYLHRAARKRESGKQEKEAEKKGKKKRTDIRRSRKKREGVKMRMEKKGMKARAKKR